MGGRGGIVGQLLGGRAAVRRHPNLALDLRLPRKQAAHENGAQGEVGFGWVVCLLFQGLQCRRVAHLPGSSFIARSSCQEKD